MENQQSQSLILCVNKKAMLECFTTPIRPDFKGLIWQIKYFLSVTMGNNHVLLLKRQRITLKIGIIFAYLPVLY